MFSIFDHIISTFYKNYSADSVSSVHNIITIYIQKPMNDNPNKRKRSKSLGDIPQLQQV